MSFAIELPPGAFPCESLLGRQGGKGLAAGGKDQGVVSSAGAGVAPCSENTARRLVGMARSPCPQRRVQGAVSRPGCVGPDPEHTGISRGF